MIADPEMLQFESEEPVETSHEVVDEFVYLIGRPTLRQFLSFVKNRAPNGRHYDVGALVDEWRAAAKYISELDKSEAPAAGHPPIQPVPAHLESLQEEFM